MVWVYLLFLLFVFLMLALDLGVFHRDAHEINIQEALFWTGVWVACALVFNMLVYFLYEYQWLGVGVDPRYQKSGAQATLQFFVGYLLEKSLSLDNVFVIALVFTYFKVPLRYQHRVLYWGILGALVLRGLMIGLGTVLIQRFDWIVYVFGLLLLWTAVKMLIERHDNLDPEKNPLIRWVKKKLPLTDDFEGDRFLVKREGRWMATPLFLALVLVESSDLLFAVDSIPAIFAVTHDPFIVFTSNIFAILGLRSLYFALAELLEKFRYMKMSLTFLLAFIGVKMMLSHTHPIPNLVSLAVIIGILGVGVVASILGAHRDTAPLVSPVAKNLQQLVGWTYDGVLRLFIILVGITVLLTGIVMIILPGPAILVIPAGLAILATEFAWARWLLKKFRNKSSALMEKLPRMLKRNVEKDEGLR
ncbi:MULTISPECIES: TerC/Alx family metal homeostasis membrane protein [unclassified Nitrospina]|uniref:TerC/Alx family metal homeostasis membrane protein n=1 Tax=unclassified Nitrospina TaxID=2638683 RepID=UPI003F98A399